MAIARAMWVSMNPSLPVAPEADWQKTMTAQLEQGVWKVSEPPLGKGVLGGSCEIDILAKDGRFLRAICTQ